VVERAGQLSPGPMCLQLAWGFDQASFLVQEARPAMEALAAETGESVGLMAVVRDMMMCLDMVESPQRLCCSFSPGSALPLSRGASAKALLAFMPETRRQALVADLPFAWHPDQFNALADELTAIRLSGYAVSNGE